MTESGPRPEFAGLYGAAPLPTASYPERTRRNAFDAAATFWFGSLDSPGSLTTTSLNVAGNRESTSPGIGKRVERFLLVVFARLKGSGEPESHPL